VGGKCGWLGGWVAGWWYVGKVAQVTLSLMATAWQL